MGKACEADDDQAGADEKPRDRRSGTRDAHQSMADQNREIDDIHSGQNTRPSQGGGEFRLCEPAASFHELAVHPSGHAAAKTRKANSGKQQEKYGNSCAGLGRRFGSFDRGSLHSLIFYLRVLCLQSSPNCVKTDVAFLNRAEAALSAMVIGRTAETIALSNGVDIECRPASYRTIRGVTAVAIVADEVAFWRTENSLNPDKEILDAARPSLATTGGPLIVISSPYGKRGELWNAFRRDFGAARRSADPDRAGAVADGEPDIASPRRRARVRARSHGGAC